MAGPAGADEEPSPPTVELPLPLAEDSPLAEDPPLDDDPPLAVLLPLGAELLPPADEEPPAGVDGWLELVGAGGVVVPLSPGFALEPQAASTRPVTAIPARSRRLLARRTLFSFTLLHAPTVVGRVRWYSAVGMSQGRYCTPHPLGEPRARVVMESCHNDRPW